MYEHDNATYFSKISFPLCDSVHSGFERVIASQTNTNQQDIEAWTIDPVIGQAIFPSPETAAQALKVAIASADGDQLRQLFGADAMRLLPLTEVGRNSAEIYHRLRLILNIVN